MDEKRHFTDDLSDIETNELLKQLPDYFNFSGNLPSSAFLTWRFGSKNEVETKFYELGKTYFDTALAMMQICLTDNRDKKADVWIFPILFHVVHGIEIYLKGFNSQYRIFTKVSQFEYQETKIEGQHDIQQLCNVTLSLLRGNKDKDLLKEFGFVKQFIDILYAHTKDMAFARYPLATDKTEQFYVSQGENISIDLEVLTAWVTRIASILENCTSFVDFQIEQTKEFQYEMQQAYGDPFGGEW
jgi:hypothetical protein